ncbi:MAG: DUF4389 domain-containing protein [Cypionkella sp.]|jgi:hypothetical protein
MTTQSADDAQTPQNKPETTADGPRKAVWLRGLFMVIVALLIGAAQSVLFLLALIQFVLMLLSRGAANAQIAEFGDVIGKWLVQAARFQTAKSDDRPWPLGPLT